MKSLKYCATGLTTEKTVSLQRSRINIPSGGIEANKIDVRRAVETNI